jgi:hypothetical protein
LQRKGKERKKPNLILILIFKDKHHSIFNYSRTRVFLFFFFFWPTSVKTSVNSKRIEKEVIFGDVQSPEESFALPKLVVNQVLA